jgi:hypothetical protein
MDASELKLPSLVMHAMQLTFTGGVTAFLYRPKVWGFGLVGAVYCDWKDRFRSGRLIRTSNVREFDNEHGYLIAITESGSRYVLVDPYLQLDSPLWGESVDPTAH